MIVGMIPVALQYQVESRRQSFMFAAAMRFLCLSSRDNNHSDEHTQAVCEDPVPLKVVARHQIRQEQLEANIYTAGSYPLPKTKCEFHDGRGLIASPI